MPSDAQAIDLPNQWRVESPGSQGWARTPRPGPQPRKKYFMVSTDTHLLPPPKLFLERIDEKFRDRLPRLEVRDGVRYMVRPGAPPEPLRELPLEGDDVLRNKAGASTPAFAEEAPLEERLRDAERDGVDGEIIFPNGPAVMVFSGRDNEFILAQCRVWNDWAIEFCRPALDRLRPVASIPTADVDMAIGEIERVAKLGYKVLSLPNKPAWGADLPGDPSYNQPIYDRLWSAAVDHDLSITFHVGSGKDPRTARGNGGAIINYVVHAIAPSVEPVVTLCGSGVFERHPKLRAATIEANAGWIPWTLDMMDEAYRKHHMWVRPKLKELPSTYFRTNFAASVAEDRSALLLVEAYGLEDNLMWANDFPHHEGSWPHSAEAIERTFGHLREETRAKVLGLNAAHVFGFEVPEPLR